MRERVVGVNKVVESVEGGVEMEYFTTTENRTTPFPIAHPYLASSTSTDRSLSFAYGKSRNFFDGALKLSCASARYASSIFILFCSRPTLFARLYISITSRPPHFFPTSHRPRVCDFSILPSL